MKIPAFCIISFLFLSQLTAQSPTDKAHIIDQTNVDKLYKLAEQHQEQQEKYFTKNAPRQIIDEQGQVQFFSHYDKDGTPVYYELGNESSAVSSRIHEIRFDGNAGLSLDGAGLNIGLWDGGNPLASHQELEGKIILTDLDTWSSHATHVAGILAATGIEPEARGMASAASIESFTSSGWQNEVPVWAADGGMITNHSYIIANPQEEYELYGIYNEFSQLWDQYSYNAPYLIMCTGASNNGNNDYYPDGSRYDLLASNKAGKNAIVVGACEDVINYTGPESVQQAAFTSWGPTDDWRIKPDLAAVGTNSFSSGQLDDANYRQGNGSSFAGPIVAGGLALLQQHYHNLTGVYMKAVTAKALILSTADEAGEFDGPDFSNGWGLFNARRAADLISNNHNTSELLELNLTEGETYTRTISIDGTQPLSIAICWNDPAATPLSNPSHNDSTLMLVNDLDMRLISEDQTSYYPWRMEPNAEYNNYTAPAEKGDNYRDNTEIIAEANLPAGVYTIVVSHKNTLQSGAQEYSMVIDGLEEMPTSVENELNKRQFLIYPNPVENLLNIDLNGGYTQENIKVSILNMAQQELIVKTVENHSSLQVDITKLIPGTYLVQLHNQNAELIGTQRIVVK